MQKHRSLLVFEESIQSPNTMKLYMHNLVKFMRYNLIDDYDGLLAIPDDKLQVMLEDYLFFLKKHLSPNTIPVAMAPLELFFTVNDRNPNFKKLHKMYPTPVKKAGNKAWTTQDIQDMLRNTTKKRTRALILFLASTGARIGTVEELKLGNLIELSGKCKAVQFYEGSNEEYWGFLIPEASKALDEYLDERRKDGEKINQNSPVFRSGYQIASLTARPISKKMAQMLLIKCIQKSSILRTKSGKRYDVQTAHGFRKRFNTILKLNSSINPNIAEKLMGHKKGLDGVYLVPTRDECFAEFQKAMTDLVIDDAERLRSRNEKLKAEKSELEVTRIELERMKNETHNTEKAHKVSEDRIKSLEEMTKHLTERLQKQESVNNEINKIHVKIKETINRESDPSNSYFPDGGPFDTRFVNLELEEIGKNSMTIFDSEFEESINVVLRKDKVYCILDKSTTCKHVLFALGNQDFYRCIKKNNPDITFSTTV